LQIKRWKFEANHKTSQKRENSGILHFYEHFENLPNFKKPFWRNVASPIPLQETWLLDDFYEQKSLMSNHLGIFGIVLLSQELSLKSSTFSKGDNRQVKITLLIPVPQLSPSKTKSQGSTNFSLDDFLGKEYQKVFL